MKFYDCFYSDIVNHSPEIASEVRRFVSFRFVSFALTKLWNDSEAFVKLILYTFIISLIIFISISYIIFLYS